MKQITTEERITVLNNALEGVKAIGALAEMEIAELENARSSQTAGNVQAADTAVVDTATSSKLLDSIIASLPSIPKKGAKASKPDEKGFRPRNGRMDIIRAVVNKMGAEAKTTELFEQVNKVSVMRGLNPINKTAFYTLVSEVRKTEF